MAPAVYIGSKTLTASPETWTRGEEDTATANAVAADSKLQTAKIEQQPSTVVVCRAVSSETARPSLCCSYCSWPSVQPIERRPSASRTHAQRGERRRVVYSRERQEQIVTASKRHDPARRRQGEDRQVSR